MNNKPVAWMLVTGHGTKIVEKKPYCEVDYWKPLYTHPAKEHFEDEPQAEELHEILQSHLDLTDDAQYDIGFDAGCKHAEKNLQAEIEALKAEKIRAYDNGYEDGRKPNTNKAQET